MDRTHGSRRGRRERWDDKDGAYGGSGKESRETCSGRIDPITLRSYTFALEYGHVQYTLFVVIVANI